VKIRNGLVFLVLKGGDIDEFDSYIVVSFTNATLVLSIGETVEEVTDTGFNASAPTLDVQQLGEDGLLQVSELFFVMSNVCAGLLTL
jgi:hypothetical protein